MRTTAYAPRNEALSGAQRWVVETVRGKFSDQLRIPALLWAWLAVQALIERQLEMRLDLTTVGRYLRRWRFTLKRPVRRMPRPIR